MKKIHIFVFVACALLWSVSAQAAQTLEYLILKEGEPIGKEVVRFEEKGKQTLVNVKTKTDVSMLFMEFHYRHERTETWENGELISMISQTNDDGDQHSYHYEQKNGVVKLMIGEEVRQAENGAFPMSLWNIKVTDKTTLLSVINGEPYKVVSQKLGDGHYKLDGDITRELWFAKDGYLNRVAFKRKGFFIEFLRQ